MYNSHIFNRDDIDMLEKKLKIFQLRKKLSFWPGITLKKFQTITLLGSAIASQTLTIM